MRNEQYHLKLFIVFAKLNFWGLFSKFDYTVSALAIPQCLKVGSRGIFACWAYIKVLASKIQVLFTEFKNLFAFSRYLILKMGISRLSLYKYRGKWPKSTKSTKYFSEFTSNGAINHKIPSFHLVLSNSCHFKRWFGYLFFKIFSLFGHFCQKCYFFFKCQFGALLWKML